MNTVTAAQFLGPYHEQTDAGPGPNLFDLQVQIAENADPLEWVTVLGQVGQGSVNQIKTAQVG